MSLSNKRFQRRNQRRDFCHGNVNRALQISFIQPIPLHVFYLQAELSKVTGTVPMVVFKGSPRVMAIRSGTIRPSFSFSLRKSSGLGFFFAHRSGAKNRFLLKQRQFDSQSKPKEFFTGIHPDCSGQLNRSIQFKGKRHYLPVAALIGFSLQNNAYIISR